MRFIGFILCAMLLWPAHGLARDGAPADASRATEARAAFRRGEGAYNTGNYDRAIQEWSHAYELEPLPRIQWNLAQAYERVGDLERAMVALRKFLDDSDPGEPTYSDANARLAALQQRLALTGVVVQGGAEGGQILIDGNDWGRTPRPDKIPLAPGKHQLVVRWLASPEFRTEVVLPVGQTLEITLPDESPAPYTANELPRARPAPIAKTSEVSRNSSSLMFYGAGAGAAAAGIAGLVYGLLRHSEVKDCGADAYCDSEAEAQVELQRNVGLVVGATLLTSSAALLFMGARRSRTDRRTSTRCGVGVLGGSCTTHF